MGRRIQKIVSSWNGSGFTPQFTNRFVYDGWNLLAIINPQSSILQSFMWGNDLSGNLQGAGGVGRLLTASLSGTNCFVTYDGNGNITALINATDKSLAARYEYSPYGELLRETGLLAHQNPFRFSTKYEDEESGLVYYGHRYYAPVQGTWYGRDPNEESDGNTLYAFVGNSPINGTDTLGLFLTWGHNRMIDNVFGDLLSNDQRRLLKMGSRFVDKKYAGVEYSFMHAMTPKTWVKEMGKEEAQQKAQRMATGWVSECLYTAIDEAGGDKNYALFILGAGMHTIMDSMCPEHADFQVWGGFNGWSSLASVGHGYKEFFHSIPSYIDNLTGDTTDPLYRRA